MLVAVTIWVKINSVDSTVLKPHLLVLFTLLITALYLCEVLWRGRLEWNATGAEVPLAVLGTMILLSFALSEFGLLGDQGVLQYACYGIGFLAGSQMFRDQRSVGWLIGLLVILATVISALALLQFFVDSPFGINFQLGSTRRVMSTLGNAAYLGGFLAMLLPVALGKTLEDGATRVRVLSGIAVAVMTVALLLTQSRSSIVAAVAACALLVILTKSARPAMIAGVAGALLVLAVAAVIAVPSVSSRLVDALSFDENVSFVRRAYFWEAGMKAVVDAPLLGHGPGSHPYIIPRFRSPDYWMNGSEDVVPHAHNEFLEAAVELGFGGLVAYIALLVAVFWKGRSLLRSADDWRRGLSAAVLSAWLALIIDNLVSVSLRQPPVGIIAWLLAGVMLSHSASVPRIVVREFTRRTGPVVITAIAAAATVWFYLRIALGIMESDTLLLAGRMLERAGKLPEAAEVLRRAVHSDPHNLVAMLDEARVLLKAQRPAEAREVMQSLQKKAPGYPTASLLEALALFDQKQDREAYVVIERAVSERSHPDSYFARFLIAARLQDTIEARGSLEQILRQNLRAGSQLRMKNALAGLPLFVRSQEEIREAADLVAECGRRFPENGDISPALSALQERLHSGVGNPSSRR
jgi:O-antigen ligase